MVANARGAFVSRSNCFISGETRRSGTPAEEKWRLALGNSLHSRGLFRAFASFLRLPAEGLDTALRGLIISEGRLHPAGAEGISLHHISEQEPLM